MGWLVLAAGAAMTLGFAPFFLWPIAVISMAFLGWLVLRAQGWQQAAGAGLVWGLGHHVTALHWLPMAFVMDAGGDWVAGLAGGVPAWLVVAAYGAAGMALICGLAALAKGRWRLVVLVGLWVALEMVKALHPLGFPWLPVGAMWAGNVVLIQAAANPLGVFGVTLLLLTVSMAMPMTIDLTTTGDKWRWLRVGYVVVLGAVLGWGWWRLSDESLFADGPTIRLVQPNIGSAHKWDERLRAQYLNQTMDVAWPARQVGAAPDVVVLPETAVAFYMADDVAVREALASRMRPSQTLVTGTVSRDVGPAGVERFYNSLVSMDGGGNVQGVHHKHLLVPFGEYIPLRGWLEQLPLPMALRTLSQSRLDYTAGSGSPLLPTAAGAALGLICYEGIFPWFVWRHAKGADWLVNVTNDNWFTGTIALHQHAALARLRAVETGLPLIRVANTGITLAWDGKGRELGRLNGGEVGAFSVRAGVAVQPHENGL